MIALIAGMLALAPCPPGTQPAIRHVPVLVCVPPKVLTLPPPSPWERCGKGSVGHCIRFAARRWNVSESMLRRKAWCESRMNPRAWNPSGASGLFQFMPGTWASTPYGRLSVWSPRWNALAAAWMHSARVGRGNEWVCR